MKSFVVACVATVALGVHHSTAEAIMENRVEKENEVTIQVPLEQKELSVENIDVKQDTNPKDHWIYIGEVLDQPEVLTIKGETEFTLTSKTTESFPPPAEPKVETTSETAEPVESPEPVVQPAEPAVEAPAPEPAAPAVSISAEEKDLFARLVEAEAKGESYDGKVAVATVVLNRVESPEFPDTVTGVIKEVVGDAYAFSPVQNGEINKPASEESIQAVEEALTREDTLNDSIYFYNPEIATDSWIRTREVVETIGNHVFAK